MRLLSNGLLLCWRAAGFHVRVSSRRSACALHVIDFLLWHRSQHKRWLAAGGVDCGTADFSARPVVCAVPPCLVTLNGTLRVRRLSYHSIIATWTCCLAVSHSADQHDYFFVFLS